MSPTARYQRFLASPTADALAANATLNYIPTTSTYTEPVPILKHLVHQGKQLEKKSEKVLSAIDSGNALCLDVETTLEFKIGGGAFLPGLDDNFLADRVVTIPIVHIVHFDESQKITQIRQYWDQAALLKQVEVIGSRGKNWPIRDAKEQIRLISSSATAVPQANTDNSRPSTSSSRDGVSITQRPGSSKSRGSSISATGDPHASLSLFAPREIIEEEDFLTEGNAVAPRASAKPAPRDLNELFVGEQGAQPESPDSTPSSRKSSIPAKAGATKKWGPNRLFDDDEESVAGSPQKTSIKTESKRYDHFEFGNGEDTPQPAKPKATNMKHQSQWNFEDFVTPAKLKQKTRAQDVRHFGWSDDEDQESPVRRPVIHQPRANLKPQFEFEDDGTPEGAKKLAPTKGRIQNAGMGLYKDHVLGDDEEDNANHGGKQPLGNVTAQFNNENRKKDFGSQWDMVDQSPAAAKAAAAAREVEQKKIHTAGNGMGARKATDSQWSLYDESPKENQPKKIYKTAGNGMGGRSDAQAWSIGGEEPQEMPIRGRTSQAQEPGKSGKDKSFWDF